MAVLLERQGKVAVVTVSRPEALNALNSETNRELLAMATELAADESVNAVVLTGDGEKSFVAGADIVEMSTLSAEQARQFSLLGRRMCAAIEESPQTWIAAVNGYALGGGCELALACDFRLASEKAKLGQPEIGLGITPGFGGTQRLPRVVGMGWAKYLCLTGKPIRADEALRIGLVQAVVPKDELMPLAMKLAGEVAQYSRLTLGYVKMAVGRALDLDLDAGHEHERDLFALCFASRDQREGMAAYIEGRRKPEFTGR
jgi:enoyl-CoA hydratase